jgi:hypothetical protein
MKAFSGPSDSQSDLTLDRIELPRRPAWRNPFAWAAILTLVVTLCAFVPVSQPSENPFLIVGLIALFGAAIICEHVGFGQFNILAPSTIPDAVLLPLTVIFIYGFCLLLVLVVKGICRLIFRIRKEES